MIHGETRIVLRNPISGNIIKDVKSENTFQGSVIADFLSSMGENAHTVPSYNWYDIVGGIFLFESAINSASKYMPAGNRMIGNGSYGVTNNSSPNELGSFSGESGVDMNNKVITQIYDYTTSQANGNINCVCLTSKIGGLIGYGNASGSRGDYVFNSNQSGNIIWYGNECLVNNVIYTFTLSGDTLTVTKEHRTISQGSVFRGIPYYKTIDLSTIKPTGVTLSNKINVYALNNNKIRIYSEFVTSVTAAGKLYFFDYDPSDDSVTLGNVTNSSSSTIKATTEAITFTPDGYLATYNTDNYLQVFKVSDSSHIINYTDQELTSNRSGNYDFSPSDGLFISYNSGYAYMVDLSSGSVRPMNMGYVSNYSNRNARYPSHDGIVFSTAYNPTMVKNPLYLATINNLGSTVSKDPSMAMKVIYTLTEA